ncbi:hypothetical protein POTOM_006226 [Populus tomentosa]|uniref:KOW domain-containing protein n=1 Tax=Populus tomentosa TaxID=118781 RepID=A0A8X8AMS9_POPTO|nr:hypothetical protein POTOM_006226 [Populus tomentosa]
MVKFLKTNKAVIILQGKYAGRKGVIVRSFDDGTRDRPYGHCLVAGIKKYPSKVIKKDSAKKTAKKSRVKCFIKLVNYQHLMPTRYTLDVDLKDVVTADCLSSKDKKVTACKETKARFEERFKTGKNRKTLFGFGAYLLAVCKRELEVDSGGMVHYLWMKVMTEQEGFWEQLEIRLS